MRESVRKLVQTHRVSTKMVHVTLHKDLKLKMLARKMPDLLDEDMKKEQVCAK